MSQTRKSNKDGIRLSKTDLVSLAKALVEKYRKNISGSDRLEGSFDSKSLTDLKKTLGMTGLISSVDYPGIFRIIHNMRGSPIVQFSGMEIFFKNKRFAIMVRDNLIQERLCQFAQVVKIIA